MTGLPDALAEGGALKTGRCGKRKYAEADLQFEQSKVFKTEASTFAERQMRRCRKVKSECMPYTGNVDQKSRNTLQERSAEEIYENDDIKLYQN